MIYVIELALCGMTSYSVELRKTYGGPAWPSYFVAVLMCLVAIPMAQRLYRDLKGGER